MKKPTVCIRIDSESYLLLEELRLLMLKKTLSKSFKNISKQDLLHTLIKSAIDNAKS